MASRSRRMRRRGRGSSGDALDIYGELYKWCTLTSEVLGTDSQNTSILMSPSVV